MQTPDTCPTCHAGTFSRAPLTGCPTCEWAADSVVCPANTRLASLALGSSVVCRIVIGDTDAVGGVPVIAPTLCPGCDGPAPCACSCPGCGDADPTRDHSACVAPRVVCRIVIGDTDAPLVRDAAGYWLMEPREAVGPFASEADARETCWNANVPDEHRIK